MPVIRDEQNVERTSKFLDYEVGDLGNLLILKSHLYRIDSHFLDSVKRSVECRGDECLYCAAHYPKRSEFNYMVFLNGNTGFIDIRASVFFAMQSVAKAQKKDMRQMSWTVIKKGEGLKTKYTTSKDDNLGKEDYEDLLKVLDANTLELEGVMERHEADLASNYTQYMSEIREQAKPIKKTAPGKKGEQQTESTEEEVSENTNPDQEVDPNDIPF